MWSKEEEGVFWTYIIPRSAKRLGIDRANPERSWAQLAAEMARKMGDRARRDYTELGLCKFNPIQQPLQTRPQLTRPKSSITSKTQSRSDTLPMPATSPGSTSCVITRRRTGPGRHKRHRRKPRSRRKLSETPASNPPRRNCLLSINPILHAAHLRARTRSRMREATKTRTTLPSLRQLVTGLPIDLIHLLPSTVAPNSYMPDWIAVKTQPLALKQQLPTRPPWSTRRRTHSPV